MQLAEAVPGAVRQQPDGDGRRVEIICNNCEGHLGHIFLEEVLHRVRRGTASTLFHAICSACRRRTFFAACRICGRLFLGVESLMGTSAGVVRTKVGLSCPAMTLQH